MSATEAATITAADAMRERDSDLHLMRARYPKADTLLDLLATVTRTLPVDDRRKVMAHGMAIAAKERSK